MFLLSEYPGSILSSWNEHTEVLLGLVVIQAAYFLCVGPLRKRYDLAESLDAKEALCFTMGVLSIYLVLLSPIHVLADQYLFSVHMFQHVVLTLIAPPLLILGVPSWLLRPIIRPYAIYRLARIMTSPLITFALFNFVFALWHLPVIYGLSMTNHDIHIIEHLMFMSAALLMWWPIASHMSELPRLSYPLMMIYLFSLSIAQIVVFGLVTFSPDPLYQWYVDAPRLWPISPLVDQQIGGIIMKVGGSLIFITLIITVFFRWFNLEEKPGDSGSMDSRI